MSLENRTTVKPSRCCDGEGESGWTLANPAKSGRGRNDRWSSQRHGGVSGRGMRVLVVVLRNELCGRGRHGPTPGASGQTARPVRRLQKSERPIVAMNASNVVGAKGPHSVDVNSEAQDRAMAPGWEIATTTKVRALQRTLSRTAKSWRSTAWAVNGPGKPDAGNPPVRFDEGRGVHRGTDNCGLFNPHRELSAYSTQGSRAANAPDHQRVSQKPPGGLLVGSSSLERNSVRWKERAVGGTGSAVCSITTTAPLRE